VLKSVLLALTVLACSTGVGHAQETAPLVLLLDGLGVYVESDYIGVSALARPLQQQGFRTRVDSHLMAKTGGVVPDIIIGHSMGGDTAIRYSRQMMRAGRAAPMVITIDAAPAPPACAVPRCINIHGPGFVNVRGATNIDAWASGARFVSHARLATHSVVQTIVLDQTAAWMAERKLAMAKAAVATAKTSAATSDQTSARTASPGAPSAPAAQAKPPAPAAPAAPKMWSAPSWTLPSWSLPKGG